MSNDDHCKCVIVKNAPVGLSLDDMIMLMQQNGDSIHHARVHSCEKSFPIFFIYYWRTIDAINAVLMYNHMSCYGRNLQVSMHKDSKDSICRMLWSK